MKKAIGYIRVSSKGQEVGTSLESQQDRITVYCKDNELELIDLVSEVKSAGVGEGQIFSWDERPRLIDLMEAAQTGSYDALVVYKFDRVSRDNASLTILKRQLNRYGVKLISTAERTEDSAQSRLLENTMAAFSEYEREIIRERMLLGKAKRKSEGKHAHGQSPYGYRSIDGTLTPNDAEAEIIALIFQMAADSRASSGRVAAKLNRDGIPPRTASKWSPATIRGILRNPAYAGEKYGKKRAHTAIVSRQLWNRAQSVQ